MWTEGAVKKEKEGVAGRVGEQESKWGKGMMGQREKVGGKCKIRILVALTSWFHSFLVSSNFLN